MESENNMLKEQLGSRDSDLQSAKQGKEESGSKMNELADEKRDLANLVKRRDVEIGQLK